ncbi:MAG: histidine phosphatase family protein [Acidimicrobiia bacterium]|nr:histidine phosphatase family protein [Acidimicrobiia bacterium]
MSGRPRRLVLVRHGEAVSQVADDPDPGLSDRGRAQAEQAADHLAPLGPLPVVASPLRRTRETAGPFGARWDRDVEIEPRVAEIAWPTDDLAARGRWLRRAMSGTWSDLPEPQRSWREEVVSTLLALAKDTVVVTHLIAINVAIGAATGDDRVVSTLVDNCSTTVVRTDGRALELVEAGAEAVTEIW